MVKIKKLNIKNISARYRLPNYNLVPLGEVKSSDECRLYFEMFSGVGLTLMGVVIPKFNLALLLSGIFFLGFGIFFMIRYIRKNKQLNQFETK
jgi:hypothetical protein